MEQFTCVIAGRGSTSAPQNVTATNFDTAALNFSGITITGTNPDVILAGATIWLTSKRHQRRIHPAATPSVKCLFPRTFASILRR
jgi:hypothetical protein